MGEAQGATGLAHRQAGNDVPVVLSFDPHVLFVVRKGVVRDVILDRIGKMDGGDGLVAQEIVGYRIVP